MKSDEETGALTSLPSNSWARSITLCLCLGTNFVHMLKLCPLFIIRWHSSPMQRPTPGVSGNSRSRSFPRMEASDSHSRTLGMDFFIPFPFPNFGNGFFPFPSRSRIDPFKIGNQKGKWEILRDACIPTFSASCTFHTISTIYDISCCQQLATVNE